VGTERDLLRRVDAYLDLAPDGDATCIDVGPLRAFVSRAPWPFYVRPRPGLDLGAPDSVTSDDVSGAAAVLAEAGQAVAFEWVEELAPSLGATLAAAGYTASNLKNGKISWQMTRLPVKKGMPD